MSLIAIKIAFVCYYPKLPSIMQLDWLKAFPCRHYFRKIFWKISQLVTTVNILLILEYEERDLVLLRHQIGIDWKNGRKVEFPRTAVYALIEYLEVSFFWYRWCILKLYICRDLSSCFSRQELLDQTFFDFPI